VGTLVARGADPRGQRRSGRPGTRQDDAQPTRAAGSAQLAIGVDITVVGLHARSARLAVVRPHNGEVQTFDPPSADEPIDLGRLFVELGFAGLQNVREEPVGFSPGTQDLVVDRIAQHVLDGG